MHSCQANRGSPGALLRIAMACVLAAPVHAGESLVLASWNLNNLHERDGFAWRPGAPPRSEEDFQALRRHALRLDADVVALQEVSSPQALARVFDPDGYAFFFSGRRQARLDAGLEADGIYLAFAVRRGRFDAAVAEDVPALALDEGGLRWGQALELRRGATTFSILNVHLKSGCFGYSLQAPRSEACRLLAAQRAPLEAWIDKQAERGAAFAVVGDFNRALDIHGQDDHLWQELDDRQPPGLALWRMPQGRINTCWRGTRRYHRNPIDFLVFDRLAWSWVIQDSFRQLDYPPAERDAARGLPSDHCPISVRLVLPGP